MIRFDVDGAWYEREQSNEELLLRVEAGMGDAEAKAEVEQIDAEYEALIRNSQAWYEG